MKKEKEYYVLCTPLYSWDGKRLFWDELLHEQWKLITNKLEDAGIEVFIALRDLPQSKSGSWLREKEFDIIEKSKGVIVLLGNTPGIYAESGYAKGVGKSLFGVRTERFGDFGEKVQDWMESMYTKVFETPEELINFLK
jgi:nucleoside 2-deoxyribosyltransferase